MTGIVKSYNETRGFGFITPLVGKPEDNLSIFFHRTAIVAEPGKRPIGIPAGAEVRFVLVRGQKGPQAALVEVMELNASALRSYSGPQDINGR